MVAAETLAAGLVTTGSGKGGEPAIQYQEVPGPAKFASHRTPQYSTIHQASYRLAQHLRVTPQPSMHRKPKAGFRLIQVTRRQSGFHELTHQQFAAPPPLIDEHSWIHAQHELHQAMIQQRGPYFERMRHAGSIDLGQQSLGEIRIQIEPAQLSERMEIFAPVLPVEPQIVVLRLPPTLRQQGIDLPRRQTSQR